MRFDEPLRHDDDPPISVFLSSDKHSDGLYHIVHCFYCGKPYSTTVNTITRVLVDQPANVAVATVHTGIGNTCKRCKATYRFVML